MNRLRWTALWASALAILLAPPSAREAAAVENFICLDCHEADEDVEDLEELYEEIHLPTFEAGVHADTDCTDCHVGYTEYHEDAEEPLPPIDCADCHDDATLAFAAGTHGTLLAEGDEDAPDCAACHGDPHYTLSHDDPESRTFPLNIPTLCGECHSQGEVAAAREHATKTHILENFSMSIHGKGLVDQGLVVSATCSSCHTPHRVLPADDPDSSVHESNVAQTCGNCHYGLQSTLARSVHSPDVTETDQELPRCNDCHDAHAVQPVQEVDFRLQISNQCGECHEELVETYFQTYHGKVSKLRGELTAKCHDCHGSHEILPASNPDSMISEANLVETCAGCHPGANASFATYLPHATHEDRENHPELFWAYWLMTGLLIAVLGFFAIHTVLWLIRSLIAHLRGEEEPGGDVKVEDGDERIYVRRFRPFHIWLHVIVVVTFLVLVLTGMCIKFPDNAWFAAISELLGGPVVLGFLHRVCAILTFGYFAAHLSEVFRKLWSGEISVRGMLTQDYSLVPLPRDAVALKDNFLWFFGLGPRPQIGRWSYWEKFDYMAVFWGVAVIGLTGLMLWFPVAVTKIVPGWWLNVATIIHSDEALLAAAFIFTVHFFNGHFRPGKFPMDLVIFTGRYTLAELKREHPRQYQDLVDKGELEKHLAEPPSRTLLIVSATFGTLFLLSGIALIIAIAWSLIFLH